MLLNYFAWQVQVGQTVHLVNRDWSVLRIELYDWFLPNLKPWRILTLKLIDKEIDVTMPYMLHNHDKVEVVSE